MKLIRIPPLLIILLNLISVGCISGSSNSIAEGEFDVVAVTGPDYRNQGTVAYDSIEGKLTSATGCEVVYTYFRPEKLSVDVLVIIGHGFMRSKKRMADLARHLAGWGLPVANAEFCNSKLWAGNHDLNGADMVAVARKLNIDRVIYTGGKGEKRFRREEIQKTILGLTTAFMLWQTGIDPGGGTWWLDGSENIKILTEAGYIKTLIP